VPAEPTVELGSRGALQTARAILPPRLGRPGLDAVTLALLGSLVLVIPTLLVLDRLSRARGAPWINRFSGAAAAFLSFVILIGILMPALGKARKSASFGEPIEILQQANIGAYDVRVVRSADPRAMLDWLTTEKFGVSEASAGAINGYVRDGWCFVAAKLRADASAEARRSPEPLLMRFPTAQPVYPMRLTATGSTNLALDLYIFGPKRAAVEGMIHVCSASIVDESSERLDSSAAHITHPALLSTIGPATIATRLRGSFTPAQMQSDLQITWSNDAPHTPTVYSITHARQMAYAIAGLGAWTLLLVVPLLYHRLTRTRSRVQAVALSAAFVVLPAIAAIGIVPALYATAETTTATRRSRHATHHGMVYLVEKVFMQTRYRQADESDAAYLDRLRAEVRAEIDGEEYLRELDIREGDVAPGYRLIPEPDGTISLETYEPTSTERNVVLRPREL
ncbi:MAG: DUF2330 domain-containing protein, partial [Phycisphaerales bacterium]|nr:DUF2330 domain-containing protein [Phycisphaerales bacterium]